MVKVTKEMRERAVARDLAAGGAYRGASIKGGKGRFQGFLGEEIAHAAFEGSVLDPCSDYDLIFVGKTWDVKTKVRKDEPQPYFDATVDQSADHQRSDLLIFVAILGPHLLTDKSIEEIRKYEYTKAWIMGISTREDFYRKARHFKSGEVDPSNGLKYRENVSLVKYSQLTDVNRFLMAVRNVFQRSA